jgi:hypothetical protein
MVLKVILVRHGERVDSLNKTWGETAKHPSNPELSGDGHLQARAVAAHIKATEKSVSAIYVRSVRLPPSALRRSVPLGMDQTRPSSRRIEPFRRFPPAQKYDRPCAPHSCFLETSHCTLSRITTLSHLVHACFGSPD